MSATWSQASKNLNDNSDGVSFNHILPHGDIGAIFNFDPDSAFAGVILLDYDIARLSDVYSCVI